MRINSTIAYTNYQHQTNVILFLRGKFKTKICKRGKVLGANGELTNGIRYINKESLFRVINPSASVNKGITEPISLTQGRWQKPFVLRS